MARTNDSTDASRTESHAETYLPGTPQHSTEPGRVERFLAKVFRRRGDLRTVGQHETR